jgi:hypothetical protein
MSNVTLTPEQIEAALKLADGGDSNEQPTKAKSDAPTDPKVAEVLDLAARVGLKGFER